MEVIFFNLNWFKNKSASKVYFVFELWILSENCYLKSFKRVFLNGKFLRTFEESALFENKSLNI